MAQDNNQNQLVGGLTGAALAGVAWWSRLDDDTQRRLRRARDEAERANDKIDGWLSSADSVRLLINTVRDWIIGTAYASQPTTEPQTIPDLNAGINRPVVATEAAARGASWPPVSGTYDATGRVTAIGELTTAALAQTYEEPRAANLGLIQATPPTPEAKVQIFRVFNALSAEVQSRALSLDQYRQAWARLFTGLNSSAIDIHHDPSRPPSAVSIVAGLTIIPLTSLSGGVSGYPYANRNTDRAMYFRVNAPSGGLPAGTPFAVVTFGTEFRYRAADGVSSVPFQPVIPVVCNATGAQRLIGATAITSVGFQLLAIDALPGNSALDLHVAVIAGQPTVQP